MANNLDLILGKEFVRKWDKFVQTDDFRRRMALAHEIEIENIEAMAEVV
jgi:hypothetical protein